MAPEVNKIVENIRDMGIEVSSDAGQRERTLFSRAEIEQIFENIDKIANAELMETRKTDTMI